MEKLKEIRKNKKTSRGKSTNDFFSSAKKQLSQESLARAHAKALTDIFAIRLAELRERQGIRQSEVKGFTQSNVSRLEARNDMKLSTLIEYAQSINMDLEITVQPRNGERIQLLRTKK